MKFKAHILNIAKSGILHDRIAFVIGVGILYA